MWIGQDADMPRITNRETANRIKTRIEGSHLVVMLATENAVRSRWVPWEIGVADSRLQECRILVVPVADASGRFHGNEYLQLYRRIELTDLGKLAVLLPKHEYQSESLRDYIARHAHAA